MPFALLLLIAVPITEIYFLIVVGRTIGALPTLALVFLTAFLGMLILRIQGMTRLAKLKAALAAGEPPTRTLLEGMVMVIGAVLLLLPGFVTDALSLVCLLPPLRNRLVRWLERLLLKNAVQTRRPSANSAAKSVLEGEFHREE